MIHVYKFNFFEENYYKYRTLLKTNVRKAKIMTRKLTFNIPNLNNRFLEGNGTGYIEAGLPDIQGGIRTNEFGWDPNGAFSIDQRETLNVQGTNSSSTVDWVKFKASTYNSIYGNSNTVQPPACKCYFCIKF